MTAPGSSESLPGSGAQFPGYASMISALSLPDKQKLLFRAAQGLDGGREALEAWSRKDLLQLICLEMGKDRKYTGVSKNKMVEHLLQLVTNKGVREDVTSPGLTSIVPQVATHSPCKRQRKGGRPARIPSAIQIPVDIDFEKSEPSWVCRNTACKAQVPLGSSFCQRCSCCICQKFDDNKDPSLWIVCTPEPHNTKMDCKLSCHIVCAINHSFAGVVSQGSNSLDGSYRCCSCEKVSSLIGCWKKQLLVARDARRVDTLCQRLSLCHKLLNGTHKHKELHEFVDAAVQKLEDELGPIMEVSANFARGLVNRLSSSRAVIELINLALEKVDEAYEEVVSENQSKIRNSDTQEKHADPLCTIEFNKVSSSSISLTVKGDGDSVTGYRVWHRIATDADFPDNPTCIIPSNTGESEISNLQPCTEYDFHVVPFSERGIGEPSEASCCTIAMDAESSKKLNLNSHDWHNDMNVKKEVCITEKLESNFRVRELGKVLHSTCTEPSGIIEGIFHGKGVKICNIIDKNVERKSARVSSDVNCFRSPGEQPSIDNGICKHEKDHKTLCSDLNISAIEEPIIVESRMNFKVEEPTRTVSRRDSTELLEETEVKSDQIVCPEVTELGDTSDHGNSQTSLREETEAASQIASHVLQTDTMDAFHDDAPVTGRGHANSESWAMQVRSTGTAMLMESQSSILSKRKIERVNRDGFGLVNGCGGTSVGGPRCAARNYEFCIKIVRWLECQGYLKEDFRMKFLTWFSLRASEHEKSIVNVFIDTLQDNPASLARQLVDTFSEIISLKRHPMVSNGFCNKVWH